MKKRIQKTLMMVLFLGALSLPNLASAQSLLLAVLACADDNILLDLDAFADLPESIQNATTTEDDFVFFEKAIHDNGFKNGNHDDITITTQEAEEEIADMDKTYRYDSAVGVFWGCADRQVAIWMSELGTDYVAWDPAWDVGNTRSYNHYFAFMAPDNGVIEEADKTHFVRSEAAVTAGYNAGFQYGYQCDALLKVTLDESCNNLFANGLAIEACDRYAEEAGDTGSIGDTGSGDTGSADTASASKSAKKVDPKTLSICSAKNTDSACLVKSNSGKTQVRVR